ncbi:hypothetical protein [Halomonas sp. N3-2A]|uniref:hypothetical protein n=1 Tax=Halomonas sp. N3-2A TaxID=2014541 RepID=UPI000B5B3230|nr:hypothetical protein [Halomonas sp. N3-2A]ASK21761.1 hypothetical protein CEK60_21885 [Halomonas sp. N3-2A]
MITDSEGNVVNATATVGADGSYTTTEDLSSLVDGEITVDASAEDRNRRRYLHAHRQRHRWQLRPDLCGRCFNHRQGNGHRYRQ